MSYDAIPQEMREYAQFIVWRYEDTSAPKPVKVPYNAKTGHKASVTDPSTWCGYDEAFKAAESGKFSGLGFVLTENDPFAFIDLDDPYEVNKETGQNKHSKPDEIFERQLKVYQEFDSYAERSPSGKGLHIIIKGSTLSGRRRGAIEVYSSERYMTMTGDVYRDAPIKDHNEVLQILWEQMGKGKNAVAHYAGLSEARDTDEQVIKQAQDASNGDKFVHLYTGEWQGYYGSQSEADLALIDIIAFYTQNRAQIIRIFRKSALGQREKAQRNDYVNYMMNKCFDNQLPPVDVDGLRNMLEESIAKKNKAKEPVKDEKAFTDKQPEPARPTVPVKAPIKSIYNPPPGLVGQLAQFIYSAAPRPVPEIALAGAIGLLAGIVGRAYNVSGTGLNQYVLLLAPTGTGKEAIARGVNKLMGAIANSVPASMEFIGPAEISSHQALTKYLSNTSKSFVSVVGEFGIQLKMMASPHAPPHLAGLMRMILDLYNKSGEGDVLRPSIYSDKDKNTLAVAAPAFTWLGESTPEKFYEALDDTMITSGLLPRFTMIEYNGDRPELNLAHINARPDFDTIEKLGTLCSHALQLNSQNRTISVDFTDEAKAIFDKFDRHCTDNINTSDREVRRHLWNRAHLKAMKLAALVAVGINPYHPCIDLPTANWALELIVSDVRNLISKFDAGEIGVENDESKQIQTVVRTIKEFVSLPFSQVEKYIPGMGQLHGERIIPYSYIQRRLASAAVFRKDKRGSSDALKRTLNTLKERGDLQEVSKATLKTQYNSTALCFMIASPKVFDI